MKPKILYYVTLFISLCASCKCNKGNKSSSAENSSTQALIKKFNPIIQGVWVKKDFVDDVCKTHSPYASFKYLSGIASILIDTAGTNTDSLVVGCSYNNHEGGNFTLKYAAGKLANTVRTKLPDYDGRGFFDIGYKVRKNDTTLILYHFGKNKKLLNKTIYLKALNKEPEDDDAGCGIQYLVNKNIFAGEYTLVDSTEKRSIVKFNSVGKVFGFDGLKTYYVNTDYMVGPQNNLDDIFFNLNDKNRLDLIYKIKKDTLNLYETKASADSINLLPGKLKYKLVKVKLTSNTR